MANSFSSDGETVTARWREAMGIHPDCERAQPGHTLGCIVFYLLLFACAVIMIYGMLRGR